LKTPIALVVQVLAALTEGVGINAATRLYGVSKNSIYRWQERLSGVKKRSFNIFNSSKCRLSFGFRLSGNSKTAPLATFRPERFR
jgi:hypothetical protein